MVAYMVAFADLTDDSWIPEYVAAVPAMIASHGGEYVATGMGPTLFEGMLDMPGSVTLFRFPSMDAVRAFLESEEYQPYADLRRKGSKASIFAFESSI